MSAKLPIIPVHLTSLIEDVEYISLAQRSMKPCVRTRTYVHKDSMYGRAYRLYYGENGDSGSNYVRKVCENIAQSLELYRDRDELYMILLSKVLELRAGLSEIIETYNGHPSQAKYKTSLIIIDMKIPHDIKIKHGIPLVTGQIGRDYTAPPISLSAPISKSTSSGCISSPSPSTSTPITSDVQKSLPSSPKKSDVVNAGEESVLAKRRANRQSQSATPAF
jgi:hypothetical protein